MSVVFKSRGGEAAGFAEKIDQSGSMISPSPPCTVLAAPPRLIVFATPLTEMSPLSVVMVLPLPVTVTPFPPFPTVTVLPETPVLMVLLASAAVTPKRG